jgi:hypothetical protein
VIVTDLGSATRSRDRLQYAGLLVPQAWSVPAAVSLTSAARETLLSTELPQRWSAVSAELTRTGRAVRNSK